MGPSRISNKKRRQKRNRLLLFSIMLILFVITAVQLIATSETEAQEPLEMVTVTVKKGDSLWKIAERYDNNKMDIRKYIEIIERCNDLTDPVLQPGQQLSVPVY